MSAAAPSLQTIGGLSLGPVQELKPLLLLAYLLIEGPTPRDRLAQLLWPGSADPRNNLRVSLCKLKGWGVTVSTDGEYLSAEHPSDHLAGAASGDCAGFLPGVELSGVSDELEDWVFGRRERLAAQAQDALLREAAHVTDREDLLSRAWCVPGAPLPSAGTLARFLSLCRAGTALHRSLSAELAELWDGTLPTQEPLTQALLAVWLEGGVTWLAGDAAQWQRPLNSVQALLEADGQSVLSLHVPPGMAAQAYAQELERQVAQACQCIPAQALTIVLSGEEHTLNSAALVEVLAGWPDVRFVVLGSPAPACHVDLTLHVGRPIGSVRAVRVPRPAAHDRARPRLGPPLSTGPSTGPLKGRAAAGRVIGRAHSARQVQRVGRAHSPADLKRPGTAHFSAQLRKGIPEEHGWPSHPPGTGRGAWPHPHRPERAAACSAGPACPSPPARSPAEPDRSARRYRKNRQGNRWICTPPQLHTTISTTHHRCCRDWWMTGADRGHQIFYFDAVPPGVLALGDYVYAS